MNFYEFIALGVDLSMEGDYSNGSGQVTVSQAVRIGGITCEVQQLLGEWAIR